MKKNTTIRIAFVAAMLALGFVATSCTKEKNDPIDNNTPTQPTTAELLVGTWTSNANSYYEYCEEGNKERYPVPAGYTTVTFRADGTMTINGTEESGEPFTDEDIYTLSGDTLLFEGDMTIICELNERLLVIENRMIDDSLNYEIMHLEMDKRE